VTTWTAGAQLGPYVLISPLGRGGMGEVWKARDSRVNRVVAIKRLHPEHVDRFRTEARAIAALNHPHICQLYDVGLDYLIMEYVEGRPLAGPLPAAEAVRLAMQIADALSAAHGKGIVHRDLKPGNVLVGESGTKLLDFGLATLDTADGSTVADVTAANAIVGTLAYLSPEQAQGGRADARSDVFAFGAVLYELIAGRRAFNGNTPAETVSAIIGADPAPLEAPAPIERLVRRCLAKQPAERFQTMAEVRGALEQAAARPRDDRTSIAVLPFANMSATADDEYFSDGLAEEIINALAQVPALKVIARTSAFAFKGQNVDIRRIAGSLDVSTILEGSVRKAGNRIRVTAQLIDAADGSHLWSQRYDRDLQDVFAVQDEIAASIAGALHLKLVHVPRPHTPNLAAYEALHRGHYHWAALTPEGIEQARIWYARAAALDPQFAAARSALAEYHFALAANGQAPSHATVPTARAEALKALEVDPVCAEAHALLGLIATFFSYEWDEAARRFDAALTSRPVQPSRTRWPHGLYLSTIGRTADAIAEVELALREDPLHLLARSHFAGILHAAGRHDEAFRQIEWVLEIDGGFGVALWYLGTFQALAGRADEARATAATAYSRRPWDAITIGLLAGVLAGTDPDRSASLMSSLDRTVGAPTGRTIYHLVRGEDDLVIQSLIEAVGERDGRVPVFLPYVRTMSGWNQVARLMNLPSGG
jgi:serine/threonine-protein kinase